MHFFPCTKYINCSIHKLMFVLFMVLSIQIPCNGDESKIINPENILKKLGLHSDKSIQNTQTFNDSITKITDVESSHEPDLFANVNFIIAMTLVIVIFYLAFHLGIIFYKKRKPVFCKHKLILAIIGFVLFFTSVWFMQSRYDTVNIIINNFIKTLPVISQLCLFIIMFFLIIIVLIFTFFPNKNEHIDKYPGLLILGLFSGLIEMSTVYLLTNSFFIEVPFLLLLSTFFFLLVIGFISSRTFAVITTKITTNVTYELRMKLINQIFNCNYQAFEKIDSGKIYSTIDNDTETVAGSTSLITGFSIDIIKLLFGIIFLTFISWIATVGTLLAIAILYSIFHFSSKGLEIRFEKVRDNQNIYLQSIDSMIKGCVELFINRRKKAAFKNEFDSTITTFKNLIIETNFKQMDLNMFGDSIMMILLGGISICLPHIIPTLATGTLITFVMIFMYLSGPISSVITIAPDLASLRVSWKRIKEFLESLTVPVSTTHKLQDLYHNHKEIESLCVSNLSYSYKKSEVPFSVGPIDLEFKKGEITFIIGGNGSGKTTFAKLLVGLYVPDSGSLTVNGKEIHSEDIGNYFSTVLNNHLFKKLYNVSLEGREDEVKKLLALMQIPAGVKISENKFSTVDLSNGQRKRLALLKCILEDSPVFLFDEVAADQDPQFRKFFYRTLLQKMRQDGKIVIAITHDDHYFDVADKIIKFDMGKVESCYTGRELIGKTILS